MASLTITTRTTKKSGKRFIVRYRLGGRAYPIEHGGSFKTKKEAEVRRNLIGVELAAGRNPADLLRAMTAAPTQARTFAQAAQAYRDSRVDIGDETRKNMHAHLLRL